MRIEHRDLHDDFPEYAQKIHDLKISDAHFAGKFEAYDELNHSIRRIELADVPMGESEFESLKVQRLHLKDELYGMLKAT